MRLFTDTVTPEDKALAVGVRNHLRAGRRVIGNPGIGLKKTLKKLEEKLEQKTTSKTDWELKQPELIAQIAMTKAGIEGEERLCEYLSNLVKYENDLSDIVCFASLSFDDGRENKDYIPDTDTILVYGKNILIIDAKNLKIKSTEVYHLSNGVVSDHKEKPLIEVHSSVPIWEKVFNNAGIEIESIKGYVCVVGDIPMQIEDGDDDLTLIHIAQLKNILKEWVKDKSSDTELKLLTEIAKAQIREEKKLSFDVEKIKKQLGV